ncbi:MAG: DUF2271 domain-containing protein [Planctomycetota bacterium]
MSAKNEGPTAAGAMPRVAAGIGGALVLVGVVAALNLGGRDRAAIAKLAALPAASPTAASSAPSAAERPAPSAAERPAPSATERPAPSAAERPAPSAAERPAPSAAERPAPSAAERPAPSATERPAPSATERPAPSATERPAPSATERPAPSATERPAPSATERPAPSVAESPAQSATESPAPMPAPSVAERPASALASALAQVGERTFTTHREDVLGTSFSLTLVGIDEADARRAERAALDEIERLRQIFSGWDAKSEVSRLNARPFAERKEVEVSEELGAVLRLARLWRALSKGAFDGYLGELHDAWRQAAKSGHEPSAEALAAFAAAAKSGPGYSVSRQEQGARITCQRAGRFDLDGIAKGYIVNRALEAVNHAAPKLEGALLELGGDLRVQGDGRVGMRAPWVIDVADPRDPAENARPLASVALRDLAIASSGGYERSLKVGGRRRAHILDPRTAQPVEGILGATVIAKDAATADALATALCVLDPEAGLRLASTAKVECAIVDREKKAHFSPGWAKLVTSGKTEPWPQDFQVELTFRLVNSTPDARGFKRHGTAAWVEDASGKRVRLLALWFDAGEFKYLPKLDSFWREGWLGSGGGEDARLLRTWSRASRSPGRYTLRWDGKDDDGRLVPQGHYRLRVDVNREHGPGRERHTVATVELDCAAGAAQAAASDQPELQEVSAAYGPADVR